MIRAFTMSQGQNQPEPLISKPYRSPLLIILGTLLVVTGIPTAIFYDFMFGELLFGLGLLSLIVRMLTKGLVIVVDQYGIQKGTELIRWSNIEKLSFLSDGPEQESYFKGAFFLKIQLREGGRETLHLASRPDCGAILQAIDRWWKYYIVPK